MHGPHVDLVVDLAPDQDDAESEPDIVPVPEVIPRHRSPQPSCIHGALVHYKDFYVPHTFAGLAFSSPIPADPESYNAVMQSPEADQWKAAMTCEYQSLLKNATWKLVPLPKGRQAVGCKRMYRVKTNSDGTVAKFKARLVAQGCSQTHGIDYDQTFSPVIKYESIHTTLALVAQQEMHIIQFDIQTAFLYGLIDTTIYMRQPRGFEVKSTDHE